jgi:hypothetical protein
VGFDERDGEFGTGIGQFVNSAVIALSLGAIDDVLTRESHAAPWGSVLLMNWRP